jgi:hypothetical protein
VPGYREGMKRAGPIELSVHKDWSTWRDLRVPLDAPATAEWLIRAKGHLAGGLGGFESMEVEPGRPLLVLVLNEPRDDAEAVTAEVDACLAASERPPG